MKAYIFNLSCETWNDEENYFLNNIKDGIWLIKPGLGTGGKNIRII